MRFFSLFTGIGGLDWGLVNGGHECVGFSEIRQSSIRIYQRHYPGHRNYGDITKIDYKSLPDFEVLTGGFPCQSFSMAGARKGFSDRRGQMIFHIYDLLMAKRPQYIVLENVKGIASHDDGRTMRNVIKLLKAAGYYIRVIMLNSSHYGSAQGRERVLFIGSRDEFPLERPEIQDATKRFRDIRESEGSQNIRFASEKVVARMIREKGGKHAFQLIGGYDRVNTLTTGVSTSGRSIILVQETDGSFRYLTELEGERLQGFPEGWTEGESRADRWYAIGNAVNCNVSRYLFGIYLKKLWGI